MRSDVGIFWVSRDVGYLIVLCCYTLNKLIQPSGEHFVVLQTVDVTT